MSLEFFGREAGFGNNHTSAYFYTAENDLVIIDLPVSTFQQIKNWDKKRFPRYDYRNVYVLITHTHGDHVGGLGLFVQYLYFVLKKQPIIVAPSNEVRKDIITLLEIEGTDSTWYNIFESNHYKLFSTWLIETIPTKHSPQLTGKCFGYHLMVDRKHVIYTGDTSTLEPFLPHLTPGSQLYVDTSVYYGMIHLKLVDMLEKLIELSKETEVYLMHLDDVTAAKVIIKPYPGIEIV